MRIATLDPGGLQATVEEERRAWSRVGWIALACSFCALNGLFWVGVAALVCMLLRVSATTALFLGIWVLTVGLSTIAVFGISTKPRVRHGAPIAVEAEEGEAVVTARSDAVHNVRRLSRR